MDALMDALRAIWGFFVACWDVAQVVAVVVVPVLLPVIGVTIVAIVRDLVADRESARSARRYAEEERRGSARHAPSSVGRGSGDAVVVDLGDRRHGRGVHS